MHTKYDRLHCNGSFRGMHDCLVPGAQYLAIIFNSIRKTSAIPGNVCAVDMRHILLLLPFLLHNLLEEEVEEYNIHNPIDPINDPSDECIGIVLSLLNWYHLYRRHFQPKDEIDIQALQALILGYLLIMHLSLSMHRLLMTLSLYLI